VSSRTKIILAVVALFVLGGTALAITLGGGGGGTAVDVAVSVQEDLAVTITAAGRIESGVRADVFAPTVGTLATVYAKDGEQVTEGAPLALMDTVPLEAQVKQATAALAAAESQLAVVNKQEPSCGDETAARAGTNAAWAGYEASLEAIDSAEAAGPSSTDIAAAKAATTAAYSSYSLAKRPYDALKASIEASAVPVPPALAELEQLRIAKEQAYAGYLQAKSAQEQLTSYSGAQAIAQAQAGADQAYAGYLSSRAQQERLEGTNLSAERSAAQAGVDQARFALAAAEETLGKATLRAPIDGVVLFSALAAPGADGRTPVAAEGAAVAPQSAVFTVVDLDGLRFSAEVDQIDVTSIELGMTGLINLDSFAERQIESSVAEIMPAAQLTLTGGTIFPVHLAIDEPAEGILIGMQGDVEIEVSSVPGAITVPIEALFDEGGTGYVYVVDGDTLVRTQVEVGTITETRAQITSGIGEATTVALSGPTELVDGMKISANE